MTKEEKAEYNRKFAKTWYQANRVWRLSKNNQYYLQNRERLLEKQRQYREANKEARNKYVRERNGEDIQLTLAHRLRTRIWCAVKNNQRAGSAVRDLGCSISELKTYLESKFTEGMSWNRKSEIHIDHIIPLSKFDLTNREHFLKANHYTNLQPMWALDNIRKRDKVMV